MNKRKIAALVTVMTMLLGVSAPAMAAEEVTPYGLGGTRTAISTTKGGSMMLNCETSSATVVPEGAIVTLHGNTGNDTQRWKYVKGPDGTMVLRPYGYENRKKVLNCYRDGTETVCNIKDESANKYSPEDMNIHITYNDKNSPSFRMWVSGSGNYKAAYVTRTGSTVGSKCIWSFSAPGSVWYYRAG